MQVDIYFYPINRSSAPTLRIVSQEPGTEFKFQCLGFNRSTQAETFHVNISDALAQVVQRMRVEGNEIRWRIHSHGD